MTPEAFTITPDDLPESIRAALDPHLLEAMKKNGGRWRLRIEPQAPPRQPTKAERQISTLLRSNPITPARVRQAIARTTAAMLDGEINPAAAKLTLYALQVLVSTHHVRHPREGK